MANTPNPPPFQPTSSERFPLPGSDASVEPITQIQTVSEPLLPTNPLLPNIESSQHHAVPNLSPEQQLSLAASSNIVNATSMLQMQSAHAAAGAQPNTIQRLKVEDALTYLDRVKVQFGDQPNVYNSFLDIMKEFKTQSIDTPGVIKRVSDLFQGHRELILGFNTFLPPGYQMTLERAADAYSQDLSNTQWPGVPLQQLGHATAEVSGNVARIAESAHNAQPKEFDNAIEYVNKIRARFTNRPDVYQKFLDILQQYQVEQRNPAGNAESCANSESLVYEKVSELFHGESDLLKDFHKFLPTGSSLQIIRNNDDCQFIPNVGHTFNEPVGSLTGSNRNERRKPTSKRKRGHDKDNDFTFGGGRQRQNGGLANGGYHASSKELGISGHTKHGSFSDLQYFSKVEQYLGSAAYMNFLKCLNLYNEEIISRVDLVRLTQGFFIQNPTLRRQFCDILNVSPHCVNKQTDSGFTGSNGASFDNAFDTTPMLPSKDRISQGVFREIDFITLQKEGVSYRLLPDNFLLPKCSGRTDLCVEVLNDRYVSFPTLSEESPSATTKRTVYEENIARIEDERFELEMIIELNKSAIVFLENESRKIERLSDDDRNKHKLDTLGVSTSEVLLRKAMERVYGEKALDMMDGLRRNPVVAIPLALRRLKTKDEEWRDVQRKFNKIWREQMHKNYLKSLDHQGGMFKQNDCRSMKHRQLLNQIETAKSEVEGGIDENAKCDEHHDHLQFEYTCRRTINDAADLIIHHVRRHPTASPVDKERAKDIIYNVLPDFLRIPRFKNSEKPEKDDMEIENETAVKDGQCPKDVVEAVNAVVAEVSKDDVEKSIMFGDEKWYLFLRLHHMLSERLALMRRNAGTMTYEELDMEPSLLAASLDDGTGHLLKDEPYDRSLDAKPHAEQLRLRKPRQLPICGRYSEFLKMTLDLLDGGPESTQQFEDSLRTMFGPQAYWGFTVDKIVHSAVRQLLLLVSNDSSVQLTNLFAKARLDLIMKVLTAHSLTATNLGKAITTRDVAKLTSEKQEAVLAMEQAYYHYRRLAEKVCQADERMFRISSTGRFETNDGQVSIDADKEGGLLYEMKRGKALKEKASPDRSCVCMGVSLISLVASSDDEDDDERAAPGDKRTAIALKPEQPRSWQNYVQQYLIGDEHCSEEREDDEKDGVPRKVVVLNATGQNLMDRLLECNVPPFLARNLPSGAFKSVVSDTMRDVKGEPAGEAKPLPDDRAVVVRDDLVFTGRDQQKPRRATGGGYTCVHRNRSRRTELAQRPSALRRSSKFDRLLTEWALRNVSSEQEAVCRRMLVNGVADSRGTPMDNAPVMVIVKRGQREGPTPPYREYYSYHLPKAADGTSARPDSEQSDRSAMS